MSDQTKTQIPEHIINAIQADPDLASMLQQAKFMALLEEKAVKAVPRWGGMTIAEALALADGYRVGFCAGAAFTLPDPQVLIDAARMRLIKSLLAESSPLPGIIASSASPASGTPPSSPT